MGGRERCEARGRQILQRLHPLLQHVETSRVDSRGHPPLWHDLRHVIGRTLIQQ